MTISGPGAIAVKASGTVSISKAAFVHAATAHSVAALFAPALIVAGTGIAVYYLLKSANSWSLVRHAKP